VVASLSGTKTGACHAPVNNPMENAVWRCDNGVTGGNDKPPAGRKTLTKCLHFGEGLASFVGDSRQKCFCVTFGESNKAYAPYPARI
jgi:hypothetical protein